MQNIKKIIVPTDFSESAYNAMRFAILFADQYDEAINIDTLNVVYPEAEPVDFPILSDSATQRKVEWSEENLQVFSETALAQVQINHPLKQLPEIRSHIEIGTTPSSVIARLAKQKTADLIIMGTHGEHSTLGKFLGSTASATIRKSSKPTLIIPKEYQFSGIFTLVYATDLSTTDPYHIWEVSKFFEPFSLIIRVVNINNETNEDSKALKMKNLEAFFKEQVPALQITFHEIPGTDIVKSLQTFNENWKINLMVLYRRHRNFFDQLFHHSITRQMVLESSIPSLIIPD